MIGAYFKTIIFIKNIIKFKYFLLIYYLYSYRDVLYKLEFSNSIVIAKLIVLYNYYAKIRNFYIVL